MFDHAGTMREAVTAWVAGLDVTALTPAQAAAALTHVTVAEHSLASMRAALAAQAARSLTWSAGERSAAHHLAKTTGTTITEAAKTIETGQRLAELPEVAKAAAAGKLSPAQTSLVADAASADPAAETRLVAMAQRTSIGELREEVRRTKQIALRDADERRRRILEARSLRTFTDEDGVGHLHLKHTPETIAQITAGLATERDRLFKDARKAGTHVRPDALDADALVNVVCGGDGAAAPAARPRSRAAGAKVIARIDWDAWIRGYPINGETCEITGIGPVAVAAVREMVDSGDAFLAAVVTKGTQVSGVAHLGRQMTAFQQTAFEWTYPTCAVEGCNAAKHLERDHRHAWADTKITMVDWMDALCSHHHDQKTYQHWALVDGHGKRAFVPPDDPRHPRHAPPEAETG